jgi:predicted PurR-regulated permease PerM
MGILYSSFLYPIGIATLLGIATSNIYIYFKKYIKGEVLPAVISTILLSLVLFLPILYFATSAISYIGTLNEFEIENFADNAIIFAQQFTKDIPVLANIDANIIEKINIAKIASHTISFFGKATAYSANFLMNTFLIVLFYMFILIYGNSIYIYIKSMLPLNDKNVVSISKEIADTIGVVFYSILLNASLQGLLFGIFVYLFGYDGMLLGILYGFSSLVPLVGGAIMWIPIALNEAMNGNTDNAIYVVLYSVIIISILADTVIKPFIIKFVNSEILKTEIKINEMLIFFSIIAGISTFGFWGMVIGPTITATFISVAKIYKNIMIETKK